MKILLPILLTLIVLLGSSPVTAEIVMQCGEISGHAYYLPRENLEGNWVRDRAKSSGFSLSLEGKKSDILWKDVTGIRSVTSDGGKVFVQGFSQGIITLYVYYEKYSQSELWTFNLEKKEMYYSTHRIGGVTAKVALYKASCS